MSEGKATIKNFFMKQPFKSEVSLKTCDTLLLYWLKTFKLKHFYFIEVIFQLSYMYSIY